MAGQLDRIGLLVAVTPNHWGEADRGRGVSVKKKKQWKGFQSYLLEHTTP